MNISKIFSTRNRGTLLDIFVFLVNLLLMFLLARSFMEIVGQASDGDILARFILFLFGLGLFILPLLGAILKRWHFHQRLKAEGKPSRPAGCLASFLFNPIFYFCLNVLIFSGVFTAGMSLLSGTKEPDEGVFVFSMFFGVACIILQTYFVYRYFLPPKDEPKSEFLRDPRSELLGDACIFLNVIFFQLLWNLILIIPMDRPPNVSIPFEIGFRLFVIGFAALLVYFPPRVFYLAEDINRPRTWLTILLAVSPVGVRFILAGI